ncbi:MAG: YncE family protein [Terriglobia bacterium]
MKLRLIPVVLLACLSAPMIVAQSTPSPALLVLAKRDKTLAIVDPATLKVMAKIPAGNDPHEVIASADGKTAYISNYGGGAYNTISVADLVAQKALPSIDLGALRGPHGLAFAGGKVYFTAEVNKVFGRYDPATHQIDWVLGTGQNRTHMIVVSPDLDHIYTSNVNSGTISIIEKTSGPAGGFPGPPPGGGPGAPVVPNGPGQTGKRSPGPGGAGGTGGVGGPRLGGPPGPPRPDWNETVLATGRGTEGFDVSPNGKELWSAAAQGGTISIIDLAAKKVIQTWQAKVDGANRVKFTPDGKYVFVSLLFGGGANLVVFDAATRKEVKRMNLGHGAAGILMQPDGSRAYVACSPDNYVVVIDLKTLEQIGRIDAGLEPDGLAWAARE